MLLFALFGSQILGSSMSGFTAAWVFILLFVTILATAFGVVHEADHLAEQLGEPYGTLILTLSIVSIEVILIAAVLLGPVEAPSIAKDSIFAVMMIIMNLVVGICLITGAARNGDQEFNVQGASAYLSMIALLTGIALVLSNYTSTPGEFSSSQAVGISAFTLLMYVGFLWMQMRSHRRYFVQPPEGSMSIPKMTTTTTDKSASIDKKSALIRSAVLLALILPIVLLAHDLAVVTEFGITAAGLPPAVGGVLIAIIVFTPESITAVKAAINNELQRSVNLCQGAFVSTVGLTVPVVLLIGLLAGKQVIMGISNAEILLFMVTLALTMQSFGSQRTSPIQGYMHLVLFGVYGLLLFNP
ncbi:calcium/proton antiporter [Pseudomonas sp. CMR5c]|nr:calcium/proton antiporter [Pseudomonas sp. CMR5c]